MPKRRQQHRHAPTILMVKKVSKESKKNSFCYRCYKDIPCDTEYIDIETLEGPCTVQYCSPCAKHEEKEKEGISWAHFTHLRRGILPLGPLFDFELIFSAWVREGAYCPLDPCLILSAGVRGAARPSMGQRGGTLLHGSEGRHAPPWVRGAARSSMVPPKESGNHVSNKWNESTFSEK